MAVTYMIVIFVGLIGSMGYNINAGILQGLGDSRTSLIFLAVATVINVVLDVSFTAVIRMGVFGRGPGRRLLPSCVPGCLVFSIYKESTLL